MNPEASPFRPGQPAPIEFFVGRINEIDHLRGMAKATAQGRFKIGFISGERGIGKSSLAYFARRLSALECNTAGCHVFLGGVQALNEMARLTTKEGKVMDNFLRRMRNLGAIEADADVRGGYKFPNHLHALYFSLEAKRAKSR